MDDYGWFIDAKYQHLVYALMRENKDEAVCINGVEVDDVNVKDNVIVVSLADKSELMISYSWARKIVESR